MWDISCYNEKGLIPKPLIKTFTRQTVRQSQGSQAVAARNAMLDVEASRLRRRVRSEAVRSIRGVPRVLHGTLSLRHGLAHLSDLLGQTGATKMMAGGQVELGGRLECGVSV